MCQRRRIYESNNSKPRVSGVMQLPLFDLPPIDMAVGADEGSGPPSPRPHLLPKSSEDQETQE